MINENWSERKSETIVKECDEKRGWKWDLFYNEIERQSFYGREQLQMLQFMRTISLSQCVRRRVT